jgi:hypothetical protein
MTQMGTSSHGAQSQQHPLNHQAQQPQMTSMYTPFLTQHQQAGQQMQQMLNNAGSGVSASLGAQAGAQPSTLAMAQQNQLQGGTQLNFMPPAQRPTQITTMFERAHRGFYPPAMTAQVCDHCHYLHLTLFLRDEINELTRSFFFSRPPTVCALPRDCNVNDVP